MIVWSRIDDTVVAELQQYNLPDGVTMHDLRRRALEEGASRLILCRYACHIMGLRTYYDEDVELHQ